MQHSYNPMQPPYFGAQQQQRQQQSTPMVAPTYSVGVDMNGNPIIICNQGSPDASRAQAPPLQQFGFVPHPSPFESYPAHTNTYPSQQVYNHHHFYQQPFPLPPTIPQPTPTPSISLADLLLYLPTPSPSAAPYQDQLRTAPQQQQPIYQPPPVPHLGVSTSIVSPSLSPSSDPRVHAGRLVGLDSVTWLALPHKQVMDAAILRAIAAQDGSLPTTVFVGPRTASVDASSLKSEMNPQLQNKTTVIRTTLFVGGLTEDVLREPRVLSWLGASIVNPPIAIRKVIPHRSSKGSLNHDNAKSTLSAFIVVDDVDVARTIAALHQTVLWDIGGAWVARNNDGQAELSRYLNVDCTWHVRERASAAGLSRHLMAVELATSSGSVMLSASSPPRLPPS